MTRAATTEREEARADPRRPLAAAVVRLLVVYVGARVATGALLALAWALSRPGAPLAALSMNDGRPGLGGFLSAWDGRWFESIASGGYPTELPRGDDGAVVKNEWAFLPLFPLLVRGLSWATGGSFVVVGSAVAVVAGAVATVLLYLLVRDRVGDREGRHAAVLFAVGPMSFLLQVPYAEALSLALVFGALLALSRRAWGWFALCGVLAALTRPGGLALAAALVGVTLWTLWRGRAARADGRPALTAGELARRGGAALAVALAGVAWPVVCAVVTGEADGYLETESSWWRDYGVGHDGFVPFTPWFAFAAAWLGPWGVAVVAVAVVVMLAGIVAGWRRVGSTIALWTLAYAGFLVAVFLPQQSSFRLLMPLAPQLGHPALSATRSRRTATVVGAAALTPVAVVLFWVVWPA